MTEAQRVLFNTKMNEFFEAIDKYSVGEKIENEEALDAWGKNLFSRYRYAQEGTRYTHALPQEHIETLKQKLKERNITEEQYKQAHGKISKLALLIQNNNYSLEELIKQQQDLDKKIGLLKQKATRRYKKLYNLTEDEYETNLQELENLLKQRKKINNLIEKNINSQDSNETNTEQNNDKKMKELLKENENKTDKIKELEHQLQEQEKAYNEKLTEETTKIEQKFKKELQEQQENYNKFRETTETNLDKQKQQKEQQKKAIFKLLCSNEDISMQELKKEMKILGIKSDDMPYILSELKSEIPGMVKKINEDSDEFTYSIKENAIHKLQEYKGWKISPRISNIQDGKVSFLVRSDLHMNMYSSEDMMKRILYPYMEFCTLRNNIPIIDLGDIAETRRDFKIEDWKNFNKEAIEQAYDFFKKYGQTINSAPNIKHYTLFGNHDEHPYLSGLDPLEIILNYTDNFRFLGVSKGSFRLGNDKIAVFHDKSWQNIISYKEFSKTERDEYIYDYLCDEMKKIAKDYIFSLIGHYHFGKINPEENFAVIGSGTINSLLFTATIKDGTVEKMYASPLYLDINKNVKTIGYEIEIYNRGKILIKK